MSADTTKAMADDEQVNNRCRLVLIINDDVASALSADQLEAILMAGDVASIILSGDRLDEVEFQTLAEPLCNTAQANGVAVIVCNHTRVAGRIGADGFQLGQDPQELQQAIEKFHPSMMVGAGNVKTRHNALVIGELQPDYLMFGKPGGDIRPEPHPKNLDLGHWWSQMVEIPCIVLGGTDIASAVDVAKSEAEFVALADAIFAPQDNAMDIAGAADRVAEANRLLNDHAPRFQTEN